MRGHEAKSADLKVLILTSIAFWGVFSLVAMAFSFFIWHVLLMFFISSLAGALCSIALFSWATQEPLTKRDELVLARLCILVLVLVQIPIMFLKPENIELLFQTDVILVLLLNGGMTLFVYYGFLRVSFGFFGAIARKRQLKQN
ncbi:MAG: hypothetical protein ACTHOO_11385 [Alcanivorax sp.]